MASTKPKPNVGVGMRNVRSPGFEKSGCSTWQPSGASLRPVITNRLRTPPPVLLGRTTRTGPLGCRNGGTLLIAPLRVATVICGFTGGVDPPIAGCEWQLAQLSELNLGPRPFDTSS